MEDSSCTFYSELPPSLISPIPARICSSLTLLSPVLIVVVKDELEPRTHKSGHMPRFWESRLYLPPSHARRRNRTVGLRR